MKGRYNGVSMGIYGSITPGAGHLAKIPLGLSKQANQRLKWFDHYHSHGCNARFTCRYFGISPQTFYRWKRRYNPRNPKSLEDRSHRPKHLRRPTWSPELVEAVLRLRERYPRWGKDKLVVLLHQEGYEASTSMVGRILRYLKERGMLREPLRSGVSVRGRGRKRPHAVRKPKGYVVERPGDLVEVDTLDLRPLPGVVFKQFTARDVISRWDVLGVYTGATSHTASGFMETLLARMPFGIKAIQVDGGAEFRDAFEEECHGRGIKLFVLPPRSPKLNGSVERAQRTHTEEFYEVTDCTFELEELRQELLQWERVYNTVRPHQALGYLTPKEFLQCYQQKSGKGGDVSLIY